MPDPTQPPSAATRPPPVGDTPAPGPARWPTIPGYVVTGELGRGGMGVVYEALDAGLKRPVALKVLRLAAPGDDALVRFRAEAEAVARLQHANIVQVYRVGEYLPPGGTDPLPYMAMEFVPGGTLADALRKGPLPPDVAGRLIRELAAAMEHAHARGIIHRDLKPANVLLASNRDPQGSAGKTRPLGTAAKLQAALPKITDFGLAKQLGAEHRQTHSGAIFGTPGYMAPEQAGGRVQDLGPATDVHALGAILYECLTGRPPFQGATLLDTLEQVEKQDPVPPSRLQPKIPRDLETICLKCLQKDPARRYAAAQALADDLGRFERGEPIRARAATFFERGLKFLRRRPSDAALVLVSGLAGLVLVAFLVGLAYNRRLTNALETAEEARTDAERASYFQRVALADQAWQEGNALRARRLLAECPERARRWEWHYLQGLTAGAGRALEGHEGSVSAVAYAPDGRLLASAGADGTVRVWDAADGRERQRLRAAGEQLYGLAISPDGTRLAAAGSGRAIHLWDLATGRLVQSWPAADHAIHALAWRPDGRQLASTGLDRLVRLWNLSDFREVKRLEGHTAEAFGLAWSPDGTRLASAAKDATVRVWDVATGRGTVLEGHTAGVLAVAWRPDGRQFASAGVDQVIALWDAASGRLTRPCLGHGAVINGLAYSPDGRLLASACRDRTVKLWDPATGQERGTLRGHVASVHQAVFRPDGEQLATASRDGTVRLWPLADVHQPKYVPPAADVLTAAWSPDGTTLATADRDHAIRLWDAGGQVRRTLAGHRAGVECIRFSPEGRRLLSVAGDHQIILWDVAEGRREREWQRAAGPPRTEASFPFHAAAFTPDGMTVIVAGAGPYVQRWDVVTGREQPRIVGFGGLAWGVAVHPGGKELAVAAHDGQVTLWDLERGQPRAFLPGATGPLYAVSYRPDGKALAAVGQDQVVRLWDPATAQGLGLLRGHTGGVFAAAWSPDGERLATAGGDQTVILWEPGTGQEALILKGAPDYVNGVAFSPDGRRLAAVGNQGWLRVWTAGP